MRPRKEINRRVGANIQRAREQARYTQEELSELLSITPNHLSAIERGVSGVTLETLEQLCQLFGVSADTLLFGKTERSDISGELVRLLAGLQPTQQQQVVKIVELILRLREDGGSIGDRPNEPANVMP